MDITRIPFEAYRGSGPYIFVSYAHKDSDKVFPIISEFHKTGFPVWYDEGIDPGNEWPKEIANALLKCSLFIVFISSSAAESKNVVREINYALAKDKPFIHIWLEDASAILSQQYPGLEIRISNKQSIMYFKMEREPENFYRKCRQSFESFGIKREGTQAEAGKAPAPANPPESTAQVKQESAGAGIVKPEILYNISVNYKQSGPYSIAQLKQKITAGEITMAYHVCPVGSSKWVHISEVPELEEAVANAAAEAEAAARKKAEAEVAAWQKAKAQAEADFQRGEDYYEGRGVEKNFAKAAEYYRKAADQGHADAQCNLGFAYDRGQGVAKDKAEAIRWWRKAADQGLAKAQRDLGFAYYSGKGVAQDYAEAARWYRKAVEQGDFLAQQYLAEMKQKGLI